MGHAAHAWRSLWLLALAAACGDDAPRTAILVQLDAPAALRESAGSLRVRLYDTDRQLVRDEVAPLGELTWPAEVPIFPGGELPRSFYLEADLLSDGVPVARQRLTGGFRDGVAVVVPIVFDGGCAVTDCSGLETCVGGACRGACYDETTLASGSRPPPRACEQIAFVDPESGADSDDTDCFSPATPCATATHAQSFLAEGRGGQVWLRGSQAHAPFRISVSGGPGAPLAFRPWPGTGVPVVDGAMQSPTVSGAISTCCGDTSAGHLVIEGLEIDGAQSSGVYIHGSADVVVRGLDVHDTRGAGPEQESYSTAMAGITATNAATDIVIEHNWVHDNTGHGVVRDDPGGAGVSGIATSNTPGPTTITDNLIERSAGMGIFAQGATTIARNVIRGTGTHAIAGLPNEIVVEHNVVCASGDAGIIVKSADRVVLRHNTVLRSGGPGVLLTSWAVDDAVEDNVLGFGEDVGIGWVGSTSATGESEPLGASEPLDDYNVLFMNAAGDYRDITEPGEHNRMEDPRIEGVAECELRLSESSPLRGAARDGSDVGADLGALEAVFALVE